MLTHLWSGVAEGHRLPHGRVIECQDASTVLSHPDVTAALYTLKETEQAHGHAGFSN